MLKELATKYTGISFCFAKFNKFASEGLKTTKESETAGEANKTRFFGNENINNTTEDKGCKVCGENSCPVWGDYKYDENENLYDYLAEKTKKPLMIDSTKNVKWLEKQISFLSNFKRKLYLIYLGRDGRAVINSRIRKYKDANVEDIITNWKDHIQKTNGLYRSFKGNKIKIHYEELAMNPVKVIQKLCELMKISYEPEMINYYQYEHHPLGGNVGTQSLLIRAQDINREKSLIHLSERNQYYYEDHPLGIKLDLRWKDELNPNIQLLFKKMTGNMNDEFEWDYP